MSDKWLDRIPAFVLFLCVSMLVFICFMIYWSVQSEEADKKACIRSGGQYVVDHYETTVINGNGSTYPVYRCDKGR